MQRQIVVIDANSQLHRVAKGPMGIDGAARWWLPALHSLCTKFAEGERLDMYVAFDGPNGSAWRTELEPSYKSDRDEKSDGMRELLAKAVEATMEAGYQVFKIDEAEADDVEDKLINATIRNLGGWPGFLAKFDGGKDQEFARVNFLKTYQAMVAGGVNGEACAPLPGLSEKTSIGGKVQNPIPVRIGSSDPARAKLPANVRQPAIENVPRAVHNLVFKKVD